MITRLHALLQHHQTSFHPVIQVDPETDRLLQMDFTSANPDLSTELITYTPHFSWYVEQLLKKNQCRYGIGGYNEERILYRRSPHFGGSEERNIHLGTDIWGPAGTTVFAPLGGVVHSTGYHETFGDYGATLILQHQLDGIAFHTLYGHLRISDLAGRIPGHFISRGESIGSFGGPEENGNWPPHLHLQIIEDMELKEGDFPGVCTLSERERYLHNCPDPDLILQLQQYAIQPGNPA
jgi:peptidoglycan LD-endopeptidase LytH